MALPEELNPAKQNDSNIPVACPYLGTLPDPHTSIAYPSGANFCHRTNNPQLVSLTHQGQVCLLEAYDNCATYRDDLVPVASIDVGGPVKKRLNWKRPLAIVAVILLFGVVLFGAYAMFSPFSTEPVDASAPSIQDSEETALASISVPTPTLIAVSIEDMSEVIDVDAIATDAAQPDTTDEEADEIEAAPAAAENEDEADASSEEAKMAPISETPAPTAAPDLIEDTAAFDFDDIDAFDSAAEFAASETEPSPSAGEVAAETAEPTTEPTTEPAAASNADIADGTAVIRTGALNVRSGPGPQFPSTALAYNGQHVILLGRNGDNSWVKVRLLNGPVGWIYAAHIEPGQPLDEIPFIPQSQR